MHAMNRIVLALIGLIAIAALACGGGGGTEEPESAQQVVEPAATTAPSDAVSTEPEATTEEPAITEAVEPGPEPAADKAVGGVLRTLYADPPTLDPALSSDTTSSFLVVEIFSGLVKLNTDLELVPDIAESWKISEEGRVYTFRLREDVKFHDGKPVTAHDFKWSIERAANPDTASPVAKTYLEDIVGVKEVLEGEATEISGLKVIDDYTIQFTIDAPKAYFLAKLTYPTAYVLDQENVESGGRTWTDNPNGTGPFRLKEYKVGERIVLERSDNFYGEPAKLESILMNLAGGQAMSMYENNEIDITGVGLFTLERVLDPDEELNKHLVVAPPSWTVSYIGFNTSMTPFNDVKFRQALNHAIDKELIAKEVLSELSVPAYGILPPGFPGYNTDLKGLEYDVELAVRLFNESSYNSLSKEDKRIVITVPGTGGVIGIDLEVVIEMWRQRLGVDVEIQQVEWATFLEDLDAKKFQAFAGLGWQADYPDPQDFLDILFHTDSDINHGAYSNLGVDAILEQARVEADIAKRIELYHEAERLIVNDAAWVPLWFTGERYVLIKPHVKGYKVLPMIVPKLAEVYLVD